MVEGNFMTANHGIGTPRSRRAAGEYLKAFVEEMNASSFVARSIVRNGVQGLSAVNWRVTPPAQAERQQQATRAGRRYAVHFRQPGHGILPASTCYFER